MRLAKFDAVVFGSPTPGVSYSERPAAYAVITNGEGMVATVKSERGYFLPGGGSLPGEAPEVTALREVRDAVARAARILARPRDATQHLPAAANALKTHA